MTDEEIKKEVTILIDEEIRPAIQMDGGNIDLVDVINGLVTVQLSGACVGCPSAALTLKSGVERYLLEFVDGVVGVEHA